MKPFLAGSPAHHACSAFPHVPADAQSVTIAGQKGAPGDLYLVVQITWMSAMVSGDGP